MYPGYKRGEVRYRMRMLGVLRPRERGDDAYLRSNPETVRQLLQANSDIVEGKGIPFTIEQLRAELGLTPEMRR